MKKAKIAAPTIKPILSLSVLPTDPETDKINYLDFNNKLLLGLNEESKYKTKYQKIIENYLQFLNVHHYIEVNVDNISLSKANRDYIEVKQAHENINNRITEGLSEIKKYIPDVPSMIGQVNIQKTNAENDLKLVTKNSDYKFDIFSQIFFNKKSNPSFADANVPGYIKDAESYGLFVIRQGKYSHVRVSSYNNTTTNIPKGQMDISDVNNYLQKIKYSGSLKKNNGVNYSYPNYNSYNYKFDESLTYNKIDLFNTRNPDIYNNIDNIGKYTAIREFKEETSVDMTKYFDEISGPFNINIGTKIKKMILVYAIILKKKDYNSLFDTLGSDPITHEVGTIFHNKYLKYKKIII